MVAEWLHSGCRVVAEARPPNKFKRFLTIASIAKKSRTLWLFLVQACPRLVVCLRLQCLRQSQFHYLLPALFAKGLLGGWHTMGGSRAEARPPHKFKRFLPPHKFKRFLTIGNSEYCKQNQVKIGGSRVAAEGGGVCRGPPIFLRCIFVASLRLLWHGCVLLPGGKISSSSPSSSSSVAISAQAIGAQKAFADFQNFPFVGFHG